MSELRTHGLRPIADHSRLTSALMSLGLRGLVINSWALWLSLAALLSWPCAGLALPSPDEPVLDTILQLSSKGGQPAPGATSPRAKSAEPLDLQQLRTQQATATYAANAARAAKDAAAGRWQAAAAGYEAIVAQSYGSGELFFQLGVSYFRLGQIGRSLYAFLRAAEWFPRDPRLKANIAFVRAQGKDAVKDLRPWYQQRLPLPLSFAEWQLAVLLLALAALVVLYLAASARLNRWLALVLVVGFASGGGVLWHSRSVTQQLGVVVAKAAPVASGPHPFDVTLFTLHEGTEVLVERGLSNNHGRWWQVRLFDGKSGWIAGRNLVTSMK